MTLRCYTSFAVITKSGNKSIIYNLSKKRDEILEVEVDCILKSLGDSIAKQDDKRLYCRVEGWIKDLKSKNESSNPRARSKTSD